MEKGQRILGGRLGVEGRSRICGIHLYQGSENKVLRSGISGGNFLEDSRLGWSALDSWQDPTTFCGPHIPNIEGHDRYCVILPGRSPKQEKGGFSAAPVIQVKDRLLLFWSF